MLPRKQNKEIKWIFKVRKNDGRMLPQSQYNFGPQLFLSLSQDFHIICFFFNVIGINNIIRSLKSQLHCTHLVHFIGLLPEIVS